MKPARQSGHRRVVIIGAGIGGLSAALRLVSAGHDVTLIEAAATPGGKMRTVDSPAGPVDAGPTVLTMRAVFDELFAAAGTCLDDHLTLTPLPCLARHYWEDGAALDLMADRRQSRANIAATFGETAAQEFETFSDRAARLFAAFDAPMMRAADPSTGRLAATVLGQPRLIGDMAPWRSLSSMLRHSFGDPRLAQLFGRYATYVGGSPYRSPALLSLIAEAEAAGVWAVRGGMHALATKIAELARDRGADIRYSSPARQIVLKDGRAAGVETDAGLVPAEAVLFNGDPRALSTGLLGEAARPAVAARPLEQRSLSAVVQAFAARPSGPSLAYHTVFFGRDPAAEFDALDQGRIPVDATLYLCAQDRAECPDGPETGSERFEAILNAPPLPDKPGPQSREDDPTRCQRRVFDRFAAFGLTFDPPPQPRDQTLPRGFETIFPASRGSLYGQSPHGLTAALKRPRARSRIPGLFLCGGGTHPGAGVPMAALSGAHAAAAIMTDPIFTSPSRRTVMPGGMSTVSAIAEPARSRSSDS